MRLRFTLLLLLAFVPTSGTVAAEPPLFGTREVFSSDSSAFFKWHGVMQRFAAEERRAAACPHLASEICRSAAAWQALVRSLAGLDLRAKVEAANAVLNRQPYVPSWTNWHESNYWETPLQFLERGGQCQDYAVAKYLLLRAAGVPAERLRVVVLRDTRLGLDHAVTVAYVGGEALLLDNLRRAVVSAQSVSEYQPYYSINEDGWWLHRGPNARYAALR